MITDHYLNSAMDHLSRYANAVDQAEELQIPAVADIWACMATMAGLGNEQPDRAEVMLWNDRTGKDKIITRGASNSDPIYNTCLRYVEATFRLWSDLYPRRQPHWSRQTRYAMSTGMAFIHEKCWLPQAAAYGGVNPADFAALLAKEGGYWNISERQRVVRRAQKILDDAQMNKDHLSNISAAVAAAVVEFPTEELTNYSKELAELYLDGEAAFRLTNRAVENARKAQYSIDAEGFADAAHGKAEELLKGLTAARSIHEKALVLIRDARKAAEEAAAEAAAAEARAKAAEQDDTTTGGQPDDEADRSDHETTSTGGQPDDEADQGDHETTSTGGQPDDEADQSDHHETTSTGGQDDKPGANDDDNVPYDMAAFTSSGGVTAAAALRSLFEAMKRPLLAEGEFTLDDAQFGYAIQDDRMEIWQEPV